MLTLLFEGWFQCRLATNPDPSDEPRGVSGYSFALAGEPDLDRIIRFNDSVAPRSHGPHVGVAVRTALLDGQALPRDNALLGSRVSLEDGARFEAANGVLAKEGWQPILPFHLRVSNEHLGEILSARLSADSDVYQLNSESRQQVSVMAISQLFAASAGVTDPVAYRRRRLALLTEDLARTTDEVQRCALEKRIRELKIGMDQGRQVLFTERRFLFMNAIEIRRLQLKGHAGGDLPALLGSVPDESALWDVELWMGAWDADALCGFVQGVINIPLLR
jgi:hypothetical protein